MATLSCPELEDLGFDELEVGFEVAEFDDGRPFGPPELAEVRCPFVLSADEFRRRYPSAHHAAVYELVDRYEAGEYDEALIDDAVDRARDEHLSSLSDHY